MRTRNRSIAGMALLSLEADDVVADGGLDIDQQHGDGADAALLEVQEATTEVESNDAAIGELENTAVALESLLESAEDSIETGGLDPLSAEILTKAVNNETAPLGTDAEEVVPALESFSSSTGRRQATVMAVEGIKDWIEKVWAKIKEFIAKGRDLAKKLYIKVRQAVQGLERRVAGLKKELEGRNEAAKKPGQVELANGDWEVAKNDVDTIDTVISGILGTYTTEAIALAERVASALAAGDEKKAAEAAGTDAEGEAKKEAAAKKEEFVVPEGLSGAARTIRAAATGKNLAGGYYLSNETLGFSIVRKTAKGNAVSKYTAAPMSHADIKAILDVLEKIAKQVVEYERAFQKRDEAARKVTEAGDKFAKAAKTADKKNEGDVREAINAAKEAAQLLDRPIRSALSYSATAINGVCSFLAAHIKHYDKK